jgi:mannosyltransferase
MMSDIERFLQYAAFLVAGSLYTTGSRPAPTENPGPPVAPRPFLPTPPDGYKVPSMPSDHPTDPTSSTRRARRLALPIALFAAALAIRLVAIGAKSLWFDEALSLDDSASMRQRFGSGFHPPVYYALLHAWTLMFGSSDLAVRLTAAIPGALTVPLVYVLGHRLLGSREGIAGAILLMVASLHVEFSQEARMYALATLLATLAAILLVWCVRLEGIASFGRRLGAAGAFTLVAYAAAGTHYLAVPVLAGLCLALLADLRDNTPLLKRLALLQLPTLALAGVVVTTLGYGKQIRAATTFATNLGGVNQTIFGDPLVQLARLPIDLFMQILPGFTVKWLVLSSFRWPATVVVGLAMVLGLVAFARASSFSRFARLVLLAPTAVALVVTVFMVGAGQLRFFVVASPFVLLAAGAGLTRVERFRIGPALLGATIALSAYATFAYLTFPFDKQPWRSVGARLDREARAGDVVLVTEPHLRIVFDRYYEPTRGVDVSGFPEEAGVRITADRLDLFLVPLVRDARRVWLVQGTASASNSDPDGLARAWLAANFKVVARLRDRGYNGDVDITLYER